VRPDWRRAQERAARLLGAGVPAVRDIASDMGYPPGV